MYYAARMKGANMSISNRYTSTGFVPVATSNVKSASGASCSSGADGANGASGALSASMAPTATSGVTTRGTTTYTAKAPETSLAGTGPAATGPVSSNPVATPAATTPVSTAPAETPGVSNTPSVSGSNDVPVSNDVPKGRSFDNLTYKEKLEARDMAANVKSAYSEASHASKEVDNAKKELNSIIAKYDNEEISEYEFNQARDYWKEAISEATTWYAALSNSASESASDFLKMWGFPYTDALQIIGRVSTRQKNIQNVSG